MKALRTLNTATLSQATQQAVTQTANWFVCDQAPAEMTYGQGSPAAQAA